MKTYTIRELSELFALPPSTLRYYEEIGLLTNVKRNGKHRIYEACHRERLGAICCFKETGMSMAQLKTFFYYESAADKQEAMAALLADHAANVAAQLSRLRENQKHIQRKLHFYQDLCQARKENRSLPAWDQYKHQDYFEELSCPAKE